MNVIVERRKRNPRTPFELSITWDYESMDVLRVCGKKKTRKKGRREGAARANNGRKAL